MRLNSLSRFINYCTEFGLKTAHGYIVKPYINKRKALPEKHKAVKDYLYKWASRHIDIKNYDRPDSSNGCRIDKPSTIWICWLQGEDNMPQTIRLCYESVKRMALNHNVHLITFENIDRFITIPESITKKMKSGKISLTHYADYLRISLLKQHGGLWIDASVYVTKPIDFQPKHNRLYTVKNKKLDNAYASDYKWAVNLIGCEKGNTLFSALEILMRKYIEEHNTFIDFFLFDYLIATLYDHNSVIKKMIDDVPYNNENFYQLGSIINTSYDKDIFDGLSTNQTFHKLSWKSTYKEKTSDGNPTFYSHLITLNNNHL